jgi:exodeoxyribonuclease III
MSRKWKIITWNVNGIRSCAGKGLFSYLRAENPDLFCLQETKAHPSQLEESIVHPENRQSFWSSSVLKKGYSGVVTYAQQPPLSAQYGLGIEKFDSEGRLVVTDMGGFVLFNIYFPNGGSGPERHNFKQEFLDRLLDHLVLLKEQGREIVVVGDYNVAYLDIDVYDPIRLGTVSGFLPEERQWFRRLIDAGFIDAYRLLHPSAEKRYTWWSYKEAGRIGNRGWRIDHICVSRGLEKSVVRAEIHDDIRGSDHCPVLVELVL